MIAISYRPGSGSIFDRVQWRCTGQGEACGPWMVTAWDWAPAMAAEHVARNHGSRHVYGLQDYDRLPRAPR